MKQTVSLRLVAVALVMAAGLGTATTRAYFVEPRELHAGWTEAGPSTYIGQGFVANVDSIYYIEWFVGELSAEGLDMPLASA